MRLFPKLALLVSGLLLAAIVGLSALYYWSEQKLIRQQAEAHQEELLQNLVLIAQDAYFSTDDILLATYTHRLLKWNPELISASVVDPQGRIKAHSEPHNIGKTSDGVTPSSALVLSQSVKFGRRYLGTASVMFSQKLLDAALEARLVELQKRVASFAMSVLFLGLVGSLIMALSLTRPIKRLALAHEQIGRGRWNIDLGILEYRKDEIGFLSRSCLAMAGQLAQLDQLKDDFVAAVSHEFRSPLAAIESYLNRMDVMRKRGDPPDTWLAHLEPISQSCQRLERYVDDLLDVAYYETGKLSLDRRTTDLSQLAQEVVSFYEPKLREKRLTVSVNASPSLPKLLIDPERIRQVFNNLITNAMKFTPEGGRIEIHLESVDSGKNVCVTVQDNGIGIAPKDQDRIFNKFEQVKTARAQVKGAKGSGLGLAISRALVELHSGTIGVNSEPGTGSAFYFKLPVIPFPASKSVAIPQGGIIGHG
jgi:signal transduction histidine kinase